jgi:CRP-like cAMP-binding protein
MGFGAMFFAVITGMISSITSSADKNQKQLDKQLNVLDKIQQKFKISEPTCKEIRIN